MYQPILNENDVTKIAELCAWCDADKKLTMSYIEKKWKATHGICIKHRDEVIKEYIKDYENNGFKIANDDSLISNDGLPIVRGTEPR